MKRVIVVGGGPLVEEYLLSFNDKSEEFVISLFDNDRVYLDNIAKKLKLENVVFGDVFDSTHLAFKELFSLLESGEWDMLIFANWRSLALHNFDYSLEKQSSFLEKIELFLRNNSFSSKKIITSLDDMAPHFVSLNPEQEWDFNSVLEYERMEKFKHFKGLNINVNVILFFFGEIGGSIKDLYYINVLSSTVGRGGQENFLPTDPLIDIMNLTFVQSLFGVNAQSVYVVSDISDISTLEASILHY